MKQIRKVNVCAVPYEMSIVDGGVLFSDKSGFWGLSGRFMFQYISDLWYLVDWHTTFGKVATAHLVKMAKLLEEHSGGNHELDEKAPLQFKAAKAGEE